MRMRVLVKGAGVAGLAVAYELNMRGAEITVLDPDPSLHAAASWLAGGMLAPWCEGESAGKAVLMRGIDAVDRWDRILPGEVERKGTLVIAPARDIGELKRFASRATGYQWLDEAQVAGLEPALEGRFRQGLFFAGEAHLNPRRALMCLRDRLLARGTSFRDGESNEVMFDAIVDCTGAARIGSIHGLRGVRGEMLYLQSPEVEISRPIRLLHPRFPVYIVPRGAGLFMVGATMIETEFTGPITARSTMELLNAAYTLHPAFAEAGLVETGAGIRPAFPDNFPRVGRDGKVLFLNGLYRHGFLLAPAMAAEVADLLFNREPAGMEAP